MDTDPDPAPAPDPVIFVIDLLNANKKLFSLNFSCLLHVLKVPAHLHQFLKIKRHKEVTKQ
jgi:hypothetical protein